MHHKPTTVILFRGRPGVGKSNIAGAWARHKNLVVLSKDDIYDSAASYVTEHITRNRVSYDSLWAILKSNVGSGATILLDYPFQLEEEVLHLQQWCNRNGVRLISFLVVCSNREVWMNRFNRRKQNPAPNQLITDLDELEQHYGQLELKPVAGEVVLDSVKTTEQLLQQVTEVIKQTL
ncbi:MAG: AAA family ATPase [Chitinophagales bacterium]|nr:AAA family ATPase [Chitinophagales bacterium]